LNFQDFQAALKGMGYLDENTTY